MKMKSIFLYVIFLFVLLILSVLVVAWLNAEYFIGDGYRVFILLILPGALIFKVTVDSFSNLSFAGRILLTSFIELIWIAVAGISTYYILLNNYGA